MDLPSRKKNTKNKYFTFLYIVFRSVLDLSIFTPEDPLQSGVARDNKPQISDLRRFRYMRSLQKHIFLQHIDSTKNEKKTACFLRPRGGVIETRGKGIFSKPNWYFDWHQPGWHRLYVHGLLWTVLFEMSLTGKSLIVLCPSSHKATKTKVSQMTNQIVDYYITKLYVLITCFGHSTARVWNICIYIYV